MMQICDEVVCSRFARVRRGVEKIKVGVVFICSSEN